jgi:adenine-specific DNA-methyltransferase
MTIQSTDEEQSVESLDKLDLRSLDLISEKKEALLSLFPEARTEGGRIDFDRLRATLGNIVESERERYGLTWPGKSECFRTIQTPSSGTLRPYSSESLRFEHTENLVIEGDNLEVLKLLQKSYLGSVKVIYIDPPYNTGHDFIYPDDYSESLRTYLEYTRQLDEEGKQFSTNSEVDGRFHSKWLSMIYPRLYLARNLLRDDGVIFITIDDKEVDNLRKCCYEIFGEENFVAQIEWQKRYTRSNNTDDFTSVIDHVIVFARSSEFRPRLIRRAEEADARYQNPDNDPRGPWKAIPFLNPLSPEERPNLAYAITAPDGRVIRPTRKAWRSEEAVWNRLVAENRIWWGKAGESETPSVKRFLSEVREGMTPINFWSHEFAGHTDAANQELKDLFGDKVFDTPKPSQLVKRMIQLGDDPDGLVVDFFAGSGVTGQAVLDLNSEDGGNRKFILVQLPEPTGREDYKTIADITKERVRRVIKKLDDEDAGKLDLNGGKKQDRGFRVFKLAESNFKTWNADAPDDPQALAEQLALHIDHIRPGRTQEDILFEILIKSGYPLTAPIETLELARKKVFSIAEGSLLVCLEEELTMEVIRAMADRNPERVVCLDAGFHGNDQLKANAVQTFKTLHRRGHDTKQSSDVTIFRTV